MMAAPTRVVLVAWCACLLSVCACAPTPVPLRDATFSELVQLAEKHADSGELESAVHTLRIAMEHIGTGHSIEDGASHRGNKEHAAVATRLSELLLELAYERIAEEHPMADPDDETLETELRREALAAAALAAKLEPTSAEAAEALAQSMPSWASGASAVACGAATNSSNGSSGMPDRVYVIHYTPLSERKTALTHALNAHGLGERTTWIETWDREQLGEEHWQLPFYDQFRFVREGAAFPHPHDGEKHFPLMFWRGLSSAELANALAHADALSRAASAIRAARSAGTEAVRTVLVLEDDAVLPSNFAACLGHYVRQLPFKDNISTSTVFSKSSMTPWHVLQLGSSRADLFGSGCADHTECTSRSAKEKAQQPNIFRKSWRSGAPWQPGRHGLGQLAHAYLLSAAGVLALADKFKPVAFPSDFMLAMLLSQHPLQHGVWWPSPGLVEQASMEGQGDAASSMQQAREAYERGAATNGTPTTKKGVTMISTPTIPGFREMDRDTLLRATAANPWHSADMTRVAGSLLETENPELSLKYRSLVDQRDDL